MASNLYPSEEPTRSVIKAHGEIYTAPAALAGEVMRAVALQERVLRGVRQERQPAVRPSPWAWLGVGRWGGAGAWARMGAAFAMGLVVASVGAVWLFERQHDNATLVALAGDHARAMVSDSSIEVVSSNMHTVKPWLSSKLGYSPAVYDLAESDFPLLGGRRGYLGREAIAVMVYGYREHRIDVYVLPQRDDVHLPLEAHVIDGFNTVGWTFNGIQYLAVSDAAASRVEDFARQLEARQRAG